MMENIFSKDRYLISLVNAALRKNSVALFNF